MVEEYTENAQDTDREIESDVLDSADAASSDGPTEQEAPTAAGRGGKGKDRNYGKGFIYMHLRDAEDALRKIDPHAKRMSKTGFAVSLGHKKAIGRFTHKADALQEYKLIDPHKGSDDIVLTPLAVEMLYGGSEAARTKARGRAFLNYDDFRQTFTECPKDQDHPLTIVREFVHANLGIKNEIERYLRLFLESAKFAGLLEGEADVTASHIKLKPVSFAANEAIRQQEVSATGEATFKTMEVEAAQEVMQRLGLGSFVARGKVAETGAGKVALKLENGECVLEINRPTRVTISNVDALTDLPEILKQLKEAGNDI
jgi:hypothetical protein